MTSLGNSNSHLLHELQLTAFDRDGDLVLTDGGGVSLYIFQF